MSIQSIAVKQDTNNPLSPGSVDRNEIIEAEGCCCFLFSQQIGTLWQPFVVWGGWILWYWLAGRGQRGQAGQCCP